MIDDLVGKLANGEKLNPQERAEIVDWFHRNSQPLPGAGFPRASDVFSSLGRMVKGEFIAPSETSTDLDPTSAGFTGAAMGGNGWSYSSVLYNFVLAKNGLLSVGGNVDGDFVFGNGNGALNERGLRLLQSGPAAGPFTGAEENGVVWGLITSNAYKAVIREYNSASVGNENIWLEIVAGDGGADVAGQTANIKLRTDPGSGGGNIYLETDAISLTADTITLSTIKKAYKTSDESVTSSSTLQNDNELLFTAAANKSYKLDALILATAATATPDIKFGWSVPSGCTIYWRFTSESGLSTTLGTSDVQATPLTTAVSLFRIQATVLNGSTGGDVSLQWAQDTSNAAATTVKAGSMMHAEKFN